jgi:hypothetical protein
MVKSRSLAYALLMLSGLVALSGCRPSVNQTAGEYFREKDPGLPLALNLKADGTFDSYNGSQTGKWHLEGQQFWDSGIELDGTNDSGNYADQYQLTRHNGDFCIETHTDYEYWCKRR